jgi:YbbR domain-containing protein
MKSLLNNWQLKLLALFTAALLWMFVVGIENTVYLFPESLEVKALDLGKTLSMQEKISPIKLYIRTEGDIKKTLNKNSFDVSLDLAGKQSGTYDLPVLVSTNNPKVSIVKVDPATVKVTVVPIMEKKVKVAAKVKGVPLKGYHLENIESTIDEVNIKAGQSMLDKIQQQIEAIITLNGTEDTTFKQTVALSLPESLGFMSENLTIEPESTELRVNIVADELPSPQPQETQETSNTAQTSVIVPIVLSGGNPDFEVEKITPSTMQITIEGDAAVIQKIQYNDVGVLIDLAEITKPGEIQISEEWITVPGGVKIKDWSPRTAIINEK